MLDSRQPDFSKVAAVHFIGKMQHWKLDGERRWGPFMDAFAISYHYIEGHN